MKETFFIRSQSWSVLVKDGKIIFPSFSRRKNRRKTGKSTTGRVLTEAYCPNGCNIISDKNIINGVSGLLLKFRRAGMHGEFVLSPIEGEFDKIILSGELTDKVKNEYYCPHCDINFKKLVNCTCQPNADMVVVGLTPKLDYKNAISFCNVTGCSNTAFISSTDVLHKCSCY